MWVLFLFLERLEYINEIQIRRYRLLHLRQRTIFSRRAKILSFDEKKEKYICIRTTEYSPGDDATILIYIAEDMLDFFQNFDPKYEPIVKEYYNDVFPSDMDP